MNEKEYLASEQVLAEGELSAELKLKQAYLAEVEGALAAGDDRRVYELLNNERYQYEVLHAESAESNRELSVMLDSLRPKLGHHLAKNLIAYLSEKFPFFYYEENEMGVFQISFGDWWDSRNFGVLDAVEVRFIFNPGEMEKLNRAVQFISEGRTFRVAEKDEIYKINEQLQSILDEQGARTKERKDLEMLLARDEKKSLFGGSKDAAERRKAEERLAEIAAIDKKAEEVPELIAKNDEEIMAYEKEEAVLDYEYRAVMEVFGDFNTFREAAGNLYSRYVQSLID